MRTLPEHNDLTPLLRAISMPSTKQPGRRYGPRPNTNPERAPVEPLPTSRRVANYQRQNGSLLWLTARQRRQIRRMSQRSVWRGRAE